MYVSRLALDHYRSWGHCVVDFTDGVNILHGANGLGKTNIVEAIEVLSTGTSHRTSSSLPLIERGCASATIRANVSISAPAPGAPASDARHDGSSGAGLGETGAAEPDTTYEVTVAARGANRARINGGSSLYMRDVVGRIPSISFTPEDQRLVSGDPATRRTLLNQAGAMLIGGYADRLQTISKIARQRAALLKQLGERDGYASRQDSILGGLEIWTGQFIEAGVALTRDRQRIVGLLAEPFAEIYRILAGGRQEASLSYEPSFDEVLMFDEPMAHISEHFQRIYPGEVARGANLIGPHRDDLSLLLDGVPAREFASNGEMWTMALALKMALFDVVAHARGAKPIVILDDVFAQLDESRRGQILEFAGGQDQVIITVAAASDIPAAGGTGGGSGLASGANIIDVAALKRAQDEYLHPDLAAFGLAPASPDGDASHEASKASKAPETASDAPATDGDRAGS